FVVPQSISRNLLTRHRAVKFPPATRFDTVWATNGRSFARENHQQSSSEQIRAKTEGQLSVTFRNLALSSLSTGPDSSALI
ncbi:hypothetical protein, partial [Paraburkholderia caledonica]|uniref:hypothetical protein n=1 Tax=Paraburkholderia caledonica TaxID=134536 RepID=UPI003709BCEF